MNRRTVESSPALAAVFGDPVAHSLSPAMHNAAYEATRLPWLYLKFRVPAGALGPALRAAAALGFRGVNLTIPLKEAAVRLMDDLTPTARRVGAVNTVTIRDGRLEGHSTDGEGFLRSLADAGAGAPRGRRVVVLGAGGAARSVAFALAGARSILIVNRSADRGRALRAALRRAGARADFHALTARTPWTDLLRAADWLVQSTPLGLKPSDPLPVPAAALRRGLVVADLIYNPAVTPLLRAARRAGARALNGEGMLVHQGALAFERWTGRRAPVAAMAAALRRALR